MHPIVLAVVVAYVALITFVGIQFSQGVKNAKDFFLSGRSLTWWIIGLSIIGTNFDTNGHTGASGNAYSIGIAQADFEWIGTISAMIIAALIFIPLYWRAGLYSIPEYLGLRYNAAVRVVSAAIVIVVSVFAMGIAPFIDDLGGIYNFLQSLLSLVQGPLLALLLLRALTQRATASAGIITLASGVALAGLLSWIHDMNLLLVAFFSFCNAVVALWTISGFTQPHSQEHLRNLTYSPWRDR